MLKLSLPKSKVIIVNVFFLTLLLCGFFIFKNFSISADEEIERRLGVITLNYLTDLFNIARFHADPILNSFRFWPNLDQYHDKTYGPLFAEFSVLLERLLQINSERQIYFFRHLLNFLVFVAGVFSLYQIAARRFSSWQFGLLAALFLVLSPRLFAESFYNSKDLVFMAFFTIGIQASLQFLQKKTLLSALWAGLAIGLAMDIRTMAIILPMMIAVFGLIDAVKKSPRHIALLRWGLIFLVFILVAALTMVAFWPWLWAAPLSRFIEALSFFSRFVRMDIFGLYQGSLLRSTQLPWHYVPVWMAITTPIAYSILFLIGGIGIAVKFIGNGLQLWRNPEEMQDIFFLSLVLGPIAAVIFLQSILYDSWRHLYFIYPAFLLVAIRGCTIVWEALKQKPRLQWFAAALLSISLINTAIWMIRAHPFQNVYFNMLAGTNWKENWEVDYWGMSNQAQLEYILAHDSRPKITIRPASFTNIGLAFYMLKPLERARLEMVNELDQADYLITNYRYKDEVFVATNADFKTYHDIKVNDEIISTSYKRAQESAALNQNPLKLNVPVLFGQSQSGVALLQRGGGWASPEAWGTWSNGFAARLILPKAPIGANTLKITARAMIRPGVAQTVAISINGNSLISTQLDQAEGNIILIPLNAALQASDQLEISLQIPNPIRPIDLGIGKDDRLLGIGLQSIEFLK